MTAVAERASLLEQVLGRPEWVIPNDVPLAALKAERVLVTGSAGSIGSALMATLDGSAFGADIGPMNVCDATVLRWRFHEHNPTVVFHLAGAKHAPDGETDPAAVLETNAVGTRNVLQAARECGARVVVASTCKACDPETVYGASKLIAERMALDAGGSVARFFNVVETSGNVFETWRGLDDGEPVPVTSCERWFISLREAVSLLLWTAVLPAGRYAVYPRTSRLMVDVAAALYPGREQVAVPRRRGDRWCEPMKGSSEEIEVLAEVPGLIRVTSPHEAAA